MANKRHRLLHTLVFSSAIAIGGCGAATAAPLEPTPIAANTHADAGGGEVSSAETSAQDRRGASERDLDVSTAADASPDLRYCENGWPTTKGASMRCGPVSDEGGADETVCCDTIYTGDPNFGADASQCCVVGS